LTLCLNQKVSGTIRQTMQAKVTVHRSRVRVEIPPKLHGSDFAQTGTKVGAFARCVIGATAVRCNKRRQSLRDVATA